MMPVVFAVAGLSLLCGLWALIQIRHGKDLPSECRSCGDPCGGRGDRAGISDSRGT